MIHQLLKHGFGNKTAKGKLSLNNAWHKPITGDGF
jgi:hypothetical protein